MGRWFTLLLVAALCAWCSTPAAAQTGSTAATAAYAQGVVAFQGGDYAEARADFLRARVLGYQGPELSYSLGASCYRLGRYAEAAQEFRSLTADPHAAGLAHYNLGLIALRQGDAAVARQEFLAARQAPQAEIGRFADQELARLPPSASPWFGYADLSAGYDDDVAPTLGTSLLPPAQHGSPFLSLLAGGGGQLSGTYADGIGLSGSVYRADYARLSQYDEMLLRLGPEYRRTDAGWTSMVGMYGSHVILGGAAFEDSGLLHFETRRAFGSQLLVGGYEYERVAGGAAYGYLTGWRQSVFVENEFTYGAAKAAVGYEHEVNGRSDLNDLAGSGQFFSVSPVSNRLYGELTVQHDERWTTHCSLSYEASDYRDPDVLLNGNILTVIARDDRLAIGSVGEVYKVSKLLSFEVEYRYLRNGSTIPVYGYQSHRLTLSLERLIL